MNKDQENQLDIPTGAVFEHYKGKKYKILGIARHSEALVPHVIYQALYDSPEFGDHAVWVRPLEMFLESIIVDGQERPRFRRILEETK